MKNRWVILFSCGRLKISKCSISLTRQGKCSKSKITPLITPLISPQMQNSDIEKCILMSASDNKIMLEIFLNGCFSQTDAKMVFILEILRVTHILDSCDTMLKRNMFLWIFLKVLVKSVSTWH